MENIGKIPPQSINSESYVLGSLLIEKTAIIKIIDFLRPEQFYKTENQNIYSVIVNLFETGKNCDIFTIIEELKKISLLEESGGAKYIIELSKNVGSAANIIQHAQYITESHMKREVIRISNDLQKKSYNNEQIDIILQYASDSIINIDNIIQQSETVDIETAIDASIQNLQEEKKQVKTGYPSLDEKLKIRPQNLILLAARPSQGKTALALNIAYNISKNIPVGFFSLEMSFNELSYRLLSNVSNVPFDHFLNKLSKPSLESVKRGSEKIKQENKLFINDTGGLSISKLRAKMTELTIKHKVGFIVVDYLQLMESKGENQNIRIGNISRNLKLLAKDFNIPILVLSQLSRDIEKRADKRPLLSDLRDSGSLEQDADTVLFLTNFHKSKITVNENGAIPEGLCCIDCEKQRNGQTFKCDIMFHGRYQRFEDLQNDFSDINENEIFKNIEVDF